MKPVMFDVSKKDAGLIAEIVERAFPADGKHGTGDKRLNLEMDITACHRNGNKLDLERLLAADNFNFWHDVAGISRHIDRTTGQLQDFFSPRFSSPKPNLRGRTSAASKRAAKYSANRL